MTPPIILRAGLVKNELEETKALKTRLEAREADIRELKLSLRNKQEELGEITVRRDLTEKRIATQTREYEINSEKLQVMSEMVLYNVILIKCHFFEFDFAFLTKHHFKNMF